MCTPELTAAPARIGPATLARPHGPPRWDTREQASRAGSVARSACCAPAAPGLR